MKVQTYGCTHKVRTFTVTGNTITGIPTFR
jgi:hypothetical protein